MLHITENLDSALDHIKKFVYNFFIKECYHANNPFKRRFA